MSMIEFPSDPAEVENPNAALALEDASYTGPDVEIDARAIVTAVFAALQRRVPGWVQHDGNLETWLVEAFGGVASEIRSLAANVPSAVFVTYGEEVLAIPIRVPTPAIGVARWTAIDELGYSIPVGTQFTVNRTGDELVVFQVTGGATIEAGERDVEGVEVAALELGDLGNGLTGPGDVVDPLQWVDGIELTEPTHGGDDGQDRDEYLDNLTMLMRVVALRPILPYDYALLALQTAAVGRAVAMDGYDPDTDTWGHARQIALVLTDHYGEPQPEQVKAQIAAALEDLREVNFIVLTIDPLYDVVDVEFEVTAFAEQDPELVREICAAAIVDALSPMNCRLGRTSPSTAAGEVIPPPVEGQDPEPKVIRRNELIGLLDRQRGVDWVDDVRINGEAADYSFAGPRTLSRPGVITGVVNVQ